MAAGQSATSDEMMKELTTWISQKVVKGKGEINEDTPLVSSGLVDSFALIQIFMQLQKIAGVKVPPSKVEATDMETVRTMFATAAKFGRPA